jgi:hypothetical protein
MDKRPISLATLRKVLSQFGWMDQRRVREYYIDQLSPQAYALYPPFRISYRRFMNRALRILCPAAGVSVGDPPASSIR